MKTNYIKYLNAQKTNGYINESEKDFIKANLESNNEFKDQFEKLAFNVDLNNDNKGFIQTVLKNLMIECNVVAFH